MSSIDVVNAYQFAAAHASHMGEPYIPLKHNRDEKSPEERLREIDRKVTALHQEKAGHPAVEVTPSPNTPDWMTRQFSSSVSGHKKKGPGLGAFSGAPKPKPNTVDLSEFDKPFAAKPKTGFSDPLARKINDIASRPFGLDETGVNQTINRHFGEGLTT